MAAFRSYHHPKEQNKHKHIGLKFKDPKVQTQQGLSYVRGRKKSLFTLKNTEELHFMTMKERWRQIKLILIQF